MPAWMAGIQVRRMRRRHPCQPGFQHSMLERRNREVLLKRTEPPPGSNVQRRQSVQKPRSSDASAHILNCPATGIVVWFSDRSGEETRAADCLLSSFTGNRAPFWIAKELGLYEKYGLDVKLVSIAAGSVSLTALLAGNVHLTTDSSSGVVGAVARGAPIVTVSNGALPYQLVALPTIKFPAELKGKTIGSSRIGAGHGFSLAADPR
jgi:hypothetical protein